MADTIGMKTDLQVFQDIESLSKRAAKIFTNVGTESIQSSGRFLVALSGGQTPSLLYRLLAQRKYQEKLDWQKCFVFWGDERCVPAGDMESNYRQAEENLLGHVSIQEDHILRIEGERGAIEASKIYTQILRDFASPPLRWPCFDLVLLGMGEDGHTASLFPNSDITVNTPVLPITAKYKNRPAERVTLTEPVINSAHHVLFLVSGTSKAKVLGQVFSKKYQPDEIPAQRIQPIDGQVTWLVDKDAADELPTGI